MRRTTTTTLGVAACAVSLCTLAGTLAGSTSAAQAASSASSSTQAAADPVRMEVRKQVQAQRTGKPGMVSVNPRLRFVARGTPLEAWSTKASHRAPIVTELRSGAGNVVLPTGTQKEMGELTNFVRLQISQGGKVVRNRFLSMCLNSWEPQRISPDAAIRSPYPQSCSTGTWTRGFVMGVQAGWSSPAELDTPVFALKPGTYTVTAQLTKPYAAALGMAATQGRKTFTLVVPPPRKASRAPATHGEDTHSPDTPLQPSATRPTEDRAGAPAGPTPDLQSVPAWGIRVSPNGNFLQFSATVWNAGSSPLVVDGFRRPKEAVMDAYQYFIDEDGNQTGYQRVGEMEWDNKDSHQHWHFRDFARYRLLDADMVAVVRSRKEAFCLANTDIVDYTVPGADWQPDGTDLHTSCGSRGSRSLREVLSSGSGDTYAQFRAGQSFSLNGLKNGVYYISVEANPVGRLVEESTTNNIALRKVTIGGKKGARTVKVGPVTG